MSSTISPRDILTTNVAALDPSDQRFAYSLLGSKKALSSKQQHWLGVLADRALAALAGPAADTSPADEVPNVAGIVALLSNAKLKHPAVLFRAEGQDIRLSIAGDRSSNPGSINVTSPDKGFRARTFYGRVAPDGEWHPSRRDTGVSTDAILAALRAFAADPAKVAAEYGHLTGVCCFCATDLTNPASIEVGYGPICAKRYGLPHSYSHTVREAA